MVRQDNQRTTISAQHEVQGFSEERFRMAFEHAAIGMALTDLQGRFLQVNAAYCAITGYSAEELKQMDFLSLTYPQDREVNIARRQEMLDGKIPAFVLEKRYVKKDGSIFWAQVSVSLVRDSDGTPLHSIALIEDISARKEAEKLIQRQAALLELSSDAIILWKYQGEIIFWNRGAQRFYGFTREEAVGRVTHDLLRTRHSVPLQQVYDTLFQTGEWEGELIHTTKDGRPVIVACRKVLVREEDGELFIMETNRDITERKRAQERQLILDKTSEKLIASLNYQVTLQEIAQMVVPALADYCRIAILDEQQQIKDIEAHHSEPEKIALVRALYEQYKDRANHTHGIQKLLETGKAELISDVTPEVLTPLEQENSLLPALVRTLELQSYMGTPLIARGRVIGALTFSSVQPHRHYTRDDLLFAQELARRIAYSLDNAHHYRQAEEEIAERKRVEAHLRFLSEASKLLASSLDYKTTLKHVAQLAVSHIADWCVIEMLSREGQFESVAVAHKDPEKVQWAQELRDATSPGISKDTGLWLAVQTKTSSLYPHVTDEMIAAATNNQQELDNLRKLGMRSIMIVPILLRDEVVGTISFVSAENGKQYTKADVVVAEDLAGRAALAIYNARLYAEAQRAIGMRADFISMASHELRTPITSLKMYTQVVQRQLARKGEESMSHSLEKMDAQLNKLTLLVRDLLNVSSIEQGRLAFNMEAFDLGEVVKEAVEQIQVTAAKHTIRVEGRITHPVLGDKDRTGQVVLNLLTNAIKYSPGADTIIVRLTAEQERAAVSVQDFGIGIAQEHQNQIMTRFYRVNEPEEKTFPGLGIGLYLSYEIIKRHGGTLTVASEKGQGSVFRFTLPYSTATYPGVTEGV